MLVLLRVAFYHSKCHHHQIHCIMERSFDIAFQIQSMLVCGRIIFLFCISYRGLE